jgi:hypothetical protein
VTERSSTKHGARVDDELARETESLMHTPSEARREEWRMAEPPGDGEPMPDGFHVGDAGSATPFVPPLDVLDARAELAAALRPTAFPADAITLRRIAETDGAPTWVIELLQRVDPVTRYETLGELWRAAGGEVEAGNGRPAKPPAQAKPPAEPAPAPPAQSSASTPEVEMSPATPAAASSLVDQGVRAAFAMATWPARTTWALLQQAGRRVKGGN